MLGVPLLVTVIGLAQAPVGQAVLVGAVEVTTVATLVAPTPTFTDSEALVGKPAVDPAAAVSAMLLAPVTVPYDAVAVYAVVLV